MSSVEIDALKIKAAGMEPLFRYPSKQA